MKVIKRFRDKETKKVYNVGTTYDGTKKRAEEIAAKGFIKLEEEPKEEVKDEETETTEDAKEETEAEKTETAEEPKEKEGKKKKEAPTKKTSNKTKKEGK